jgi:hypothetical protein
MIDTDWVIIGNMLVAIGLFIATLYRIKIEKDQVRVVIKNAVSAQKLQEVRRILEKEKDIILEMKDGKEIYEMLKCIFVEQ